MAKSRIGFEATQNRLFTRVFIYALRNIPSNEEKGLHEPNFISTSQISDQEKIKIIQKGFQLQAERKISLKKYYESTDPNSLVQSKEYNLKYDAIRKNKFYQQSKPSNN